MATYREAIDAQLETTGLWDDLGEIVSDEAQEVMDVAKSRHPNEWTGSRSDWLLLYAIADGMDGMDGTHL